MPILITDFDGTFTGRDFFDLILEHHDPPGAREHWRRFQRGEATHFEGIAGVFASLRTDAAGADALIDALAPAPGTAAAAARLKVAGWSIVIASAGCRWYIERLLRRVGVDATIHASPGDFAPDTGLIMRPDPDSPYFDPRTGIDKAAIVRDALARHDEVAYAGDSDTDRDPALLVPPERRFAIGRLQQRFAAVGVPYVPIAAWPEIADRLLED